MLEISLQAGRRPSWRVPIAVRAQHNRNGAQRRAAGG
jgi:hypothetical protein